MKGEESDTQVEERSSEAPSDMSANGPGGAKGGEGEVDTYQVSKGITIRWLVSSKVRDMTGVWIGVKR